MKITKEEIYLILKEYSKEKYTEKIYKILLKEGKFWNNSSKRNAILTEFDNFINRGFY